MLALALEGREGEPEQKSESVFQPHADAWWSTRTAFTMWVIRDGSAGALVRPVRPAFEPCIGEGFDDPVLSRGGQVMS